MRFYLIYLKEVYAFFFIDFNGDVMMDNKKIVFGQFFTKDRLWLKPQVLDFIKSSNCHTVFDPFAGGGHLLNAAKNIGFTNTVGFDIDGTLGWPKNDSLLSIPHINDQTIIITNPPYLSNYSASRKGIMGEVRKYFTLTEYDDLYLLSLENMLKSQKYVVAIIPETFVNSNFKKKNLLHSITILEENPFDDTDTPVVVACFDGIEKDFSKIDIYINETKINNLAAIENMRLIPKNNVKMAFNDIDGWLAVRCVDTTNPKDMLKFDFKKNIKYDWENGIKTSSRLLTLIQLDIEDSKKGKLIEECNNILGKLRESSGDIIFSPFKGNMKNGRRRRRLDFRTCRAIIEIAYNKIEGKKEKLYEQLQLF